MTESTGAGPDEQLDDPGRDPAGLDPPRNLFGGGSSQDSGQGAPSGTPGGTSDVGPGEGSEASTDEASTDEASTDEAGTRADTGDDG